MNWNILQRWGSVLVLTLAGAFDTVAGRHAAVGLGAALGLNLLGASLFLFSTSFLTLQLVSGSGGLNWLAGIPSTSRKVFIFLIIVGWEQSLVFHAVHFINCTILSHLTMCVPCMDMISTSMSTTSTGSLHLK